MSYSAFTDAEMNLCRNAVESAEYVRVAARSVVKVLQDTFAKPHPTRHWGVKLDISDNDVFLLETPFGKGKGRLDLHIDATGTVGRYVILKELTDSKDETSMREVWAFKVSRDGVISHGDNGEHSFDLHGFDEEDWKGRLAQSIFYAIARSVPGTDHRSRME
ncbi:hypothetical protein [Phytopseudomonas seleniipraecipitans]|uniref:Uncharacterized protein n=1 Tax=Phytopseudomonas seleniipraecipitans TaxID=640205 RepID=A0A1G7JD04_9GAMM|nr:hypothetical protein [Pseudomonas seleniipraecipitans]SDF22810.1 hypothetical protein SAMN05216381_1076 [Pseudomonas seleniipraecipitans]